MGHKGKSVYGSTTIGASYKKKSTTLLKSLGLDVGTDSLYIKKDQRIKESCIQRIKESKHVLKEGLTTLFEVRTFEIRRYTN